MNFAKKTMSAILATVMAASSLFVGTTAFAAQKTFTPVAEQGQTFTRQADVVRLKESEKYTGDYSNSFYYYDSKTEEYMVGYYNEYSYFSFTPKETGTYAITLDDTSKLYSNCKYTKDEDGYVNRTYSYTSTPDAAADTSEFIGSSVSVYSDAAMSKNVASVEADEYVSGYHYIEVKNQIAADIASRNYVKGYETVDLIAGKTYYIRAYAPAIMQAKYDDANVRTENWTNATGSFSIEKVDWDADLYLDSNYATKVKINIPSSVKSEYISDYEVNTDAYGNKFVEVSVNNKPVAEVTYVGAIADVFVPEIVNGCVVESVSGTRNKSIKSLTLSSGVKYVSGFSGLDKLETVTFNNVVERIGSFSNDTALKAITIPGSVKNIDDWAFEGCSALSSVTIGDGVKSIGSYAFYNTALKGIVLPGSVKSIDEKALGYIENLDENTVDPYDLTSVKVDGFAIGGINNAAAIKYAAQNGLTYCDVSTGCPHPYVVTTVPATLFAAGSKTTACPLCGATATKTIKKKTFKISSLKASKKALTVKAAKQADIAGYIVDYSTSKKFTKKTTKSVKVNSTGALKKKITGLKSGKKYYVRVRAFNVVEGKTVYSKYTAVKSVKVK